MNSRRCGIGAAGFVGLLLLVLSVTSPVQAQESNPEGLVFGCLTDAGYDVLDVYGDEDAGMVLMEIVSDEWDEDLRSQIVWGWYCLYPAYEDSEVLITGLMYDDRYILAFFVDRADFGDWLDGEMSDSDFASAYTYGVYDTQIEDWISETDFIHTYFPGAEPTIEEEGLIPRPGQQAGEPVFFDDFGDDESGLPDYQEDMYEIGYLNGEYHINVVEEGLTVWPHYLDLDFDDFAVQVQARHVGGSDQADYGLVIRMDPDSREFYNFAISANGYYNIYKHTRDGWVEMVGFTWSGHINGDGEWDLLRVEADGPTMSFLVNGEPLVTIDDDDFTSGTVGLYAATYEDPEMHVAFDNLTMWTGEAPATGWSLVLQDDFTDEGSGWPSPFEREYCEADYEDNEYHVRMLDEGFSCGVTFPEVYADFAFEVDARQVEGADDGYYGIMFRSEDRDDPFMAQYSYDFSVDHYEGRYELLTFPYDEALSVPMTESDSVNLGEEVNRFRVEAVGDEITLYVNGDLLSAGEATHAYPEGRIGFVVWGGMEPPNHVAYDNLKLYVPAEEGPVTGEPTFGPITWYRYLDKDGQWHDPVTEYPRGATVIIAVWEYENMEDGLEWGYTWLHDGAVWSDWSADYEWRGGESGEWGAWIYYRDGTPLESGEWEVEFYVEGELIQTATTRIQ